MATTKSIADSCAYIEDYVENGDAIRMKYPTLSLCEVFEDTIEFPLFNVYDDYIDELKDMAVTIDLSDEEYRRYYQNPKLLCNDIYRNSELDFIIMRLNGIYDPKDFTSKHIYMLSQDNMSGALSKIYSSNKKMIDVYNQDNPVD